MFELKKEELTNIFISFNLIKLTVCCVVNAFS